ncbi:MAG: toll/interleukin-1 receptor domain-containing protein [Bacteroidales bacterium]|nr:toll/interleukin-1 receptor domain-containing protein [Bacteroidales bacterium]
MSRKFNTKKFIKDVLNDKYALVIGNEIILDTKIEPTADIHQYFLRKVNENSNVQYENYHEIALDKNERINPIRRLIEDGDITFRAEDVSKDLMALLETRLFTTVLTTTTDGFLEAAMRKVWGNELRVVNIYDKETVDELQKALKACRRGKKYNQPTLIYVFGKLDIDDLAKKYIKTDADAILLIEKWMRMDVEANNEMLDFIRSKRLLALGCKYDNWYFRFFWYVMTGVNKSSEENAYDGRGEVAFSLDKTDKTEGKLLQFLDRTDICILGDATTFITNITKTLTEDSDDAPFRQQIVECRRRGGIFISYCSKDALAASQLFFQLCEKKYDVWIDNARLYGGDNYESGITDAINAAKVVITVLSAHVADDLKLGDTDHYYNKEWRIAQQFDDKTIIPLAINGYDLRSDYHQVYESIITQQPSGIDLMDSDGFSKLITSINEHL